MKTKSSSFSLSALIRGSLCGLALVLTTHAADWWPFGKATDQTKAPISVSDTAINRDAKGVFSLAPLVKQVTPSVVNISINRTVVQNFDPSSNPMLNDPFFRRFFNQPEDEEGNGENGSPGQKPRSRSRQETSLGSGVIITKDGYILTNNHVVEPADVKGSGKDDKDKASITVFLPGSKKQYPAKIIGRDPRTDVALIKIDANDLSAITLADSDKIEIGDMVLAIGNPLGVGQTVTSGIVSARNRSIPGFGIDYQEFIQTDAAINPGNSGGALVDMEGRLIGLNTAIISRSGGNQGIGFAVPINTGKFVLEQLLKNGKVIRGYLGLRLQEIDSDLASELKLGDVSGAVITDIETDGPSAKSDLKPRDVITEFQGKKVSDVQTLRFAVSQTPPGTKVTLKVLRDGKEKAVDVTLKESPDPKNLASKTTPDRDDANEVLVGVNVNDLTDALRKQFNVPKEVKGAIIVEVEAGSPAADAGIHEGEVVQEVGRQPVTNAQECVSASKKFTGDKVLVRVWGNNGSRYVLVKKKS